MAADPVLLFLHENFVAFSEVLATEVNSWEACKAKLQHLQDQWLERGLFGTNALSTIARFKAQINWQEMLPDQFSRFYRFTFYICRDPGKRNIPMDLAVAAWRLILRGRFRLLDRWCAFAAGHSPKVVTEDTWRQVLDFSRTIHEDLSNYDAAGAWAVLLDEFVEDMRASRRRNAAATVDGGMGGGRTLYGGGSSCDLHDCRRVSSGADLSAGLLGGGVAGASSGVGGGLDGGDMAAFMACLSPRCGSKRREPDVDVVAEQLSAIPLGSGAAGYQHPHHPQQPGGGGGGGGGLPPIPQHSFGGGGAATQGFQLPHGHAYAPQLGRGVTPDAFAKRQCFDRQLHEQPQQPHQHPQQLLQQQALQLPHDPQRPQPHAQKPHEQAQQPLLLFVPAGVGCGAVVGLASVESGLAGGGSCGGGGGGATPMSSSGHGPMSCSTGSVDSDGGSHGPAGAAAMDCLQDASGAHRYPPHHPQQHHLQHQQPQLQQRRAIKARRSGVSDIVKTAVTDALGFQ